MAIQKIFCQYKTLLNPIKLNKTNPIKTNPIKLNKIN